MNYRESTNLIEGVQQGVVIGQQSRVDELNDRIHSRHFPDRELAPNFSMRPTPTKYVRFPIANIRTPGNEPIRSYIPHSTADNFNPGTSNAPVGTYLANVDVETQLRYQPYSVKYNTHHDIYVPSSSSDLYNTQVYGRREEDTHPLLFKQETYKTTIPDILRNGSGIGADRFFNHTRTQLRNMSM
jgi:hypothetical protein